MIQTLPGVFRLFSEEPMLSVQPRGFARFIVKGTVPHFRDPGLRFESRIGDVEVPLAEHSRPSDAFRALKRQLPRGIHASASESSEGLEIQLTETTLPAARLPLVQVFTTDLKQRVRRLADNSFELVGPTGTDCFITLRVDTGRALISVPKATSARRTAERLAGRIPAGYHAEVEGAVVTLWKNSDLRTLAA